MGTINNIINMELLNDKNNLIYNVLNLTKSKIYFIHNNSLIIDYIILHNNILYFIFNKLYIANINDINNLLLDIEKLKNIYYNYKIVILTQKKIKCNYNVVNIYNTNINIIIQNLILYLYKNQIYLYDNENDIIMI